MDTFFSTDTTDLPEATHPELLELRDGDEVRLRVAPVAKRLGRTTVRMLAYNGSIPGPTLRMPQGAEVVVHVTNELDIDTTVHWHGLRLENRFDGVPHETQQPIPPGGEFTYRIQCPDAGAYWFHPHVHEDATLELGLYGVILVDPAEPAYWPPAHRELVLTLDDLLLEDGTIAPLSRTETNYVAMGRYGNVMLTGGETDPAFAAQTGEVLRLWLDMALHPAARLTDEATARRVQLAIDYDPRPPYGGIDYRHIPALPRAMRAAIGLTAPVVAGRAKRLTRAGR